MSGSSRQGLREHAQRMRQQPTAAERALWERLRGGQWDGMTFVHQHMIPPYVVDFLCVEAKLIIEVDGSSHDDRAEYDMRRQGVLERHGYRVIRFTNAEVLNDLEAVLRRIRFYTQRV